MWTWQGKLYVHMATCKYGHWQDVIEISKTYLPTTAIGYSSPKLTIHLEDGITFIDRYTEEFDVIITDCTDYDTGKQ